MDELLVKLSCMPYQGLIHLTSANNQTKWNANQITSNLYK